MPWSKIGVVLGIGLGFVGLIATIFFGVASVIDARFSTVHGNVDRVQHSVDRLQQNMTMDHKRLAEDITELQDGLQELSDEVEDVKETATKAIVGDGERSARPEFRHA